MSRCFPYPPPGYVRNPVAVAEAESTAKLQKERGKAEKNERGKAEKNREKRSDKKTLHQGETSKHSKHSHKKREHEDFATAGQEPKKVSKRKHEDFATAGQEPKKVSKEPVEQLEKSGLSEEHGAPCFVQTVRDSPESSQDSSKRRKVVLPSPSQAKNGNVLRIKIKSSQDSQSAILEKQRVLEQPVSQQMGSASSLLSKQNSNHHKVNVRSTSAAQLRVHGDSQAVQKERLITGAPSKTMQRVVPQPAVKVAERVDSQLSVKVPVVRSDVPPKFSGSAGPSAASVIEKIDPPPVQMARRVQHPPFMLSQKVDPQLVKVSQKETRAAVGVAEAPQFPVLQKPKVFLELASLPEEPCFSGRNVEAVQVQEAKLSRSDRKKIRKAEKKEKKYRDLFVTWNPVSIENEGSDLGDQDWLLNSTRNSDAGMVKCGATDGSVPFHSMEQWQPSLQPRASFLPDLHIYQMPYVVPF